VYFAYVSWGRDTAAHAMNTRGGGVLLFFQGSKMDDEARMMIVFVKRVCWNSLRACHTI
jgi:hypothetical protein